jgi:uncharacterized protein YodC (DUF2158 family)
MVTSSASSWSWSTTNGGEANMEEETIGVGSVVELRSNGSPEMVVWDVALDSDGDDNLDAIRCQWFKADNELQEGVFRRCQLNLLEP